MDIVIKNQLGYFALEGLTEVVGTIDKHPTLSSPLALCLISHRCAREGHYEIPKQYGAEKSTLGFPSLAHLGL